MNGLLIFLASSNKYKKLSALAFVLWISFMVIRNSFELGYVFPIINLIVFGITVLISKFIKNSKFNKMYSVFSILVWSVLVDVVCYFAFPSMIFGQTIFTYILNGILFNFKYVFYNILYLFLLEVTPLLMSKLKLNLNGTCFKNESLILKMK